MFQMFIKTGCRYSWPQQPGSQVTEGVMWGGLVGNRAGGWGGGGSVLDHVLSAAFWVIFSSPPRELNTWDWLHLCLRQLARLELSENKRVAYEIYELPNIAGAGTLNKSRDEYQLMRPFWANYLEWWDICPAGPIAQSKGPPSKKNFNFNRKS